MKCPRCNNEEEFLIETNKTGPHQAIICGICRRWIKWANKKEVKNKWV